MALLFIVLATLFFCICMRLLFRVSHGPRGGWGGPFWRGWFGGAGRWGRRRHPRWGGPAMGGPGPRGARGPRGMHGGARRGGPGGPGGPMRV